MDLIKSSQLPNNLALAFVTGLLSYFISMVPSAVAILKDSSKRNLVDFEKKFLYMPYLYGLVNVLLFVVIIHLLPKQLNSWWTLGLLIAILYSGGGRLAGLPQNVYEVGNINLFHLGALIVYLPLYGIVFKTLSEMLTN